MGLVSFEADLLFAFLKNKKKYIKFSRRIKPVHFKNKVFRWSYEVLEDHYKKYRELPSLKVFKNELLKTSFPSEEKKLYYVTLKKLLLSKKKVLSKYIEDNISEKINREEFLIAVDKSLKKLEEDGVLKARNELFKSFLSDEDYNTEVRILKDWRARQVLREKLSKVPLSKRFISTPYSKINAITSGIQFGEVATVAGITEIGKSIIVGEFGVNSFLEGLNVLHFPLENTKEQTSQRYDSRITEVKYDTIKFYKFSSSQLSHFEKVFNILSSRLKNDIVIKELKRNETDIFVISKTIELLRASGFDTEFLIVDSLDIMKASSDEYRDRRLDRASIYWDFKDFCILKRLPGLTTTQLKVTSKWKVSTVEDLSEAYDKARILDIIYIMSQTEEDAKRNIVRFDLDKNRDGPGKIGTLLYKEAPKMRFLEVI